MVYIEQVNPDTGQMQLVAEQLDHGLVQLSSASFTNVSDAVNDLEPYSHNLGFYKYAFYIAAKRAGAALSGNQAQLTITEASASPKKVQSGQGSVITASVNSQESTDGVSGCFL